MIMLSPYQNIFLQTTKSDQNGNQIERTYEIIQKLNNKKSKHMT